jgi:1,4-alpha-glucan branching enzyme
MKQILQTQGARLELNGKMAKPINFYCSAPDAHDVSLQGDFTRWAPLAMQRRIDGWWCLQVHLTHGHHQYRFLIDGQPRLDPRAAGVTHNEANEEVSVIAVS